MLFHLNEDDIRLVLINAQRKWQLDNIEATHRVKWEVTEIRDGRSKSGYYKGYFCGSTYELVYTIYNIDHNIHFKRNKKGFQYEYNGKTHNYYPDYITAEGYVEIKGYWTDLVDIKLAAVNEPIKILYEKDLQYAFDYVSKTYLNGRKSNYQSLYDKTHTAILAVEGEDC